MNVIRVAEFGYGGQEERRPLVAGSGKDEVDGAGRRSSSSSSSRRHLWHGMRRSSVLLALLVVFFVCYLALGAAVFGAMERPVERQLQLEMRDRIKLFASRYSCLAGTK